MKLTHRALATVLLAFSAASAQEPKKPEPDNHFVSSLCQKGDECPSWVPVSVATTTNGNIYILDEYYVCIHDSERQQTACMRRDDKTKAEGKR